MSSGLHVIARYFAPQPAAGSWPHVGPDASFSGWRKRGGQTHAQVFRRHTQRAVLVHQSLVKMQNNKMLSVGAQGGAPVTRLGASNGRSRCYHPVWAATQRGASAAEAPTTPKVSLNSDQVKLQKCAACTVAPSLNLASPRIRSHPAISRFTGIFRRLEAAAVVY